MPFEKLMEGSYARSSKKGEIVQGEASEISRDLILC